jgi:hypothetical protein
MPKVLTIVASLFPKINALKKPPLHLPYQLVTFLLEITIGLVEINFHATSAMDLTQTQVNFLERTLSKREARGGIHQIVTRILLHVSTTFLCLFPTWTESRKTS